MGSVNRVISVLAAGLLWAGAAGAAAEDNAGAASGSAARIELSPIRAYAALGRGIEVRIERMVDDRVPEGAADDGPGVAAGMELVLWTAWGTEFARGPVGFGVTDLREVFPVLESTPPAAAVWVQLEAADDSGADQSGAAGARAAAGQDAGGPRRLVPVGAPLVIVPMWSVPRYESALTALARQVVAARSQSTLEQLLATARASGPALDRQVVESGAARVFSGYRLLIDRRVRLKTSLGEMEFALRHDAAPNHAAAFLRLVEGGFYDGAPIHRIATGGPEGGPVLVQAGDPTGGGAGGCGERFPFEPGTLAQRFGVLSMARDPGDPNSAKGQIVIALDGAETAGLEVGATAFAELTRGAAALRAFAGIPIGPRDPENPASPRDLPLAQLRIERAWTVPAPARGVIEEAPAEQPPEPIER